VCEGGHVGRENMFMAESKESGGFLENKSFLGNNGIFLF